MLSSLAAGVLPRPAAQSRPPGAAGETLPKAHNPSAKLDLASRLEGVSLAASTGRSAGGVAEGLPDQGRGIASGSVLQRDGPHKQPDLKIPRDVSADITSISRSHNNLPQGRSTGFSPTVAPPDFSESSPHEGSGSSSLPTAPDLEGRPVSKLPRPRRRESKPNVQHLFDYPKSSPD